jgi:uncharacterized membrane protein YeaQ/YmgE (transglycosylase-associated protein family)
VTEDRAHLYYNGALLLLLGLLGGLLVFHAVPQENREILSTIVGGLVGALVGVNVQRTFHNGGNAS